MTRKGEIAKASVCQYQTIGTMEEQKAFKNGFVKGAEWADRTMIEKACKWMKEQVYQEYGGGPLERLIPDTRIEEFRKAMEG